MEQTADRAGVVAIPPLIYAAALLAGGVLHVLVPVAWLPAGVATWWRAAPILLAVPIVVLAFRTLIRARTTFDVRKPTTAIVTDSVFRYSRNPMYVSLTLVYLGIAALVNSLWVLIFLVPVVVVMRKGVIEREERYLERKFGDEYLRYKRSVRRWI